ncbi:DUF938 domain-containing protein [Hyphobacterium sp.]|uniref:DUF938 domain-containing protein n=1 Tax=Hyphobacterium sp. TaxID=2004662 RepID=UPI003B51C739
MVNDYTKQPVALESRDKAGEKLFSPSAARNAVPIRDVLSPRLPESAKVLEIGCGTGEHAEAVCRARPDLIWTPSDPDPSSRASATARSREIANLQPAAAIDASAPGWAAGLQPVDAIVCCNVIHIAPWAVAEGLAAGAAQIVAPGGVVFLYGPFLLEEGSAPSNLAFDENLKSRNPLWGVRPLDTVTDLFARHKFGLQEKIAMPAKNYSLVFSREPQ